MYPNSDRMVIFEDPEERLKNLKSYWALRLKEKRVIGNVMKSHEDKPEEEDVVKPSDLEDKFCKNDKSGA